MSRNCFCGEDLPHEASSVSLGCGCDLHTSCLFHYVKVKLENRTSISNGIGIVCPFYFDNSCRSQFPVYIVPDYLESIVTESTDLVNQEALCFEDINKFRRWLANEMTEEVEVAKFEGNQGGDIGKTTDLIEATTKMCPKCSHRSSHFHGHGY